MTGILELPEIMAVSVYLLSILSYRMKRELMWSAITVKFYLDLPRCIMDIRTLFGWLKNSSSIIMTQVYKAMTIFEDIRFQLEKLL